jgi:hypothetical protein
MPSSRRWQAASASEYAFPGGPAAQIVGHDERGAARPRAMATRRPPTNLALSASRLAGLIGHHHRRPEQQGSRQRARSSRLVKTSPPVDRPALGLRTEGPAPAVSDGRGSPCSKVAGSRTLSSAESPLKVEVLEDEAQRAAAPAVSRPPAGQMSTRPTGPHRAGRSSPASTWSRDVLPDPDGPVTPTSRRPPRRGSRVSTGMAVSWRGPYERPMSRATSRAPTHQLLQDLGAARSLRPRGPG